MSILFKKACKDVTQRKLRALLTIFGIALGVLALTALNTASALVTDGFQYTDNRASLPDIQFTTAPTQDSLAHILQQQAGVKLVQAQDNLTTRWTFAGGHFPLNLVGISTFNSTSFNTFQLLSGRFPLPGAQEVVLESSANSVSPVQLGEKIALNVSGINQRFTVTGFMHTQGLASATILGVAQAYMEQGTMKRIFHLPGANTFLVRVNNPTGENVIARQLATVIENQHVAIYQTAVGQATYSNATKTDTLFSIIGVISLVSLLLSAFLLFSTITAVISEQIPIIGTMKALGASRLQVFISYMLLVGIYAFSGTIIGLIAGMFVGYALTAYISSVLNLDIGGLRLEPGIIVPGILVGLCTPLLAAIGPVYTGMRITVHQALAGYGIQAKSGGAGKRSYALRSVLAFLPQQVHFAFRSLFRKRARLILTLAGLSITCSVFLAALVGISSLGASATSLLQTYHVEVEVVLSQPRASQQLENVISSINGVSLVEHSIGIPAKIGSQDVRLIGLEAKNHFYISHLQAGRWLTPQDLHAAVINSHMASQLGLHVGDLFTLHDSLHTQQLRIVGITIDNNGVTPTSLGVVLTTVAQADAFARIAANESNTFMVQTTSQNPAEIDATAVRIEDKLDSLNLLVKVQTTQQLIQTSQGELQAISVLFAIAIATVALVGAMSLFNSLAMSILERRREIGILRSMGATTGTIIRIFWLEGTTIAFLSWMVALILGLVSAYGFVQVLGALLVPLPFTFNPWYLLWMLAFVLAVASVASIGPALAAGKIKIAQTLYYE